MRPICFVALLLVACLCPRADASPPVSAVVVIEGLTWRQIEGGEVGGLYVLAHHGAAGLMSIGASADDAQRFALTLQTGRRLAPVPAETPERLRRRYASLRWLTDELARAGVEVTLHLEPSREHLRPLLAPPSVPNAPSAQVQIWWIAGDSDAIGRSLERAIGALQPDRDRVLIIGLPPGGERLSPIIAAGAGLATGMLTSATTRTKGLVSNVDLAPTILRWHNVPLRAGEHPMRVTREDPFSGVQRLARLLQWNAQGLIPVGVLQVGGGLLAVLGVLRLIRQRGAAHRKRLLLSVALVALLSLPAGTVLTPYLSAATIWQYVGTIMLLAGWLSLLAHWGVWHEPFRAYVRACALNVLVIVADAIAGQHGVKSSMYSAYALSGFRFYGIGNEMMGVLVGSALTWGLYGLGATLRAAVWLFTALVLATPAWGANLGGLLTSATGLGCAWEWSKKRKLSQAAPCVSWLFVGVLAAVGIIWLDSLSASPSHLGDAWLRWQERGWMAVQETLLSKLALTARVLLDPLAWAVMLVILLAIGVMQRSGMFTTWRNMRQTEYLPWLICMGAAFVFNDSGFVPAAAILSIGLGALLTRKLQEVQSGPST